MRLGPIALVALCLVQPVRAGAGDRVDLATASIPTGRAWFCYEAKSKANDLDSACYRSRMACFEAKTVADARGSTLQYPLCAERESASVVTFFRDRWTASALPTSALCETTRAGLSGLGASNISECTPVGAHGLTGFNKKVLDGLVGHWRCIDSVSEHSRTKGSGQLWAIARGGCFRSNEFVSAEAQCEARKDFMATQLRQQYKLGAASSGEKPAVAPDDWIAKRLEDKMCRDVVTGVFAFSYQLGQGEGLSAYKTGPECEYAREQSAASQPSQCEFVSFAEEREKELSKVAAGRRDLVKVQLSASICWATDRLSGKTVAAKAKKRLRALIEEDKRGLKRAGARKSSCRRVKPSIQCHDALVDESVALADKCTGLPWFDDLSPSDVGALGQRLRTSLARDELPDQLTSNHIARGIRNVRKRVASCGSRYDYQGKLEVTMVIAANGTVDDILVSGADDDVHACVSKFVKRARFAKARNKTAVKYPLILR